MTGNVLQFLPREEYDPHISGEAICACCQHEWVAVSPVDTTWLTCPACSTDKGRYRYQVEPNDDVWHCACGNDIFRITTTAAFCINCGNRQAF